MSSIVNLPIEEIRCRADARQQNDDVLAGLEESIGLIGLRNPIRVRPISDGYEVVAGRHRLAACELLGHREIACIVVDEDDLHAELAMIDENLFRAELSPVDRAKQTARRKAIYEQLHPQTARGGNWQGGQFVQTASSSFATDTAKAIGKNERTVLRHAERGQKVTDETLVLISATKLGTGVFPDRLNKLPPDRQVETATEGLAGLAERARADCEVANAEIRPPAPFERDSTGSYTRFLELVDQLEALPIAALIADSGRQRAVLGQRASGLADRMSEIMEGLNQ